MALLAELVIIYCVKIYRDKSISGNIADFEAKCCIGVTLWEKLQFKGYWLTFSTLKLRIFIIWVSLDESHTDLAQRKWYWLIIWFNLDFKILWCWCCSISSTNKNVVVKSYVQNWYDFTMPFYWRLINGVMKIVLIWLTFQKTRLPYSDVGQVFWRLW